MNDLFPLFIIFLVGLIYVIQRAAYNATISNQEAYEEAKRLAQKRYLDALYGRDTDDSN